jgi:hypothetical protein
MMKVLSVFMAVCMLFLSSFSGIANVAQPKIETSCCQKAAAMQACHQHKKQASKDNCNGMSCNMMLSCGLCGFLVVEPVTLKPRLFFTIEKPATLYIMGDLSDYNSPGWQPPEA